MQFKVLYLKNINLRQRSFITGAPSGRGPPLSLRPERVRTPGQRWQQTALATVLSSRSDRGDSSVKRGTRRRGQRVQQCPARGRRPCPAPRGGAGRAQQTVERKCNESRRLARDLGRDVLRGKPAAPMPPGLSPGAEPGVTPANARSTPGAGPCPPGFGVWLPHARCPGEERAHCQTL